MQFIQISKKARKKTNSNLFDDFFPSCLISALSEDPEFTDQIENITAPAGRNIKLACSVKNLGTYKVRTIPHTLCACSTFDKLRSHWRSDSTNKRNRQTNYICLKNHIFIVLLN